VFINLFGVMMKRILILTIAAVMMLSSAMDVQSKNYTKAISLDPLDFLINRVLNVTYEHQISKENSFTVFASYYSPDEYWSAIGIGGSYRWYLSKVLQDNKIPIEGLSVGPMARFIYWSWELGSASDTYAAVILGGEAAYKFVFDDWVIEPIIRLGIQVTDVSAGYNGWGVGVNAGYAW
jgi:hypothetical protein